MITLSFWQKHKAGIGAELANAECERSEKCFRQGFLTEVTGWASSYATPTFTRDEKNLVKLQSFLSAKLPN